MQKLWMAFGLSIAVAACGSSDKINRGGAGESCTSHNDCSGALICLNGLCAVSAAPAPAADGGAITPVTPTVLSKSGESCTKRSDCETGLGCFSGICALTAPPPVDAGVIIVTDTVYVTVDAGVNTALGGRGETCTKTQDCAIGLICLPLGDASGLGICDVANYGLIPGTSDCANECLDKIDCCELPLGTGTYNSCADLLKAMTPYTALNCSDQAAISRECFLYKTYCDCATSNPWVCTAGKCIFNNQCDPTVTGEKMKGCPAKTRSGVPVPACNKTNACAAAASVGCKTADDCTASGTSDTGETCSPNECVCLADIGRCYRKCNADLDCKPGYNCDTTKQVCKPAGACTTDAYCAQTLQNVSAKCVVGACKIPCKIDQDCSPSGLLSTKFNGMVCGADKYCASLGCSSNAECSTEVKDGTTVLGSVKMFCAAHPATAGAVNYASAITD
jgi:hypothetical protein